MFSNLSISLFKASEETGINTAITRHNTSISTSVEYQNVAGKNITRYLNQTHFRGQYLFEKSANQLCYLRLTN